MIRRFLNWLSRRLPEYRDGHLVRPDGSLYMGRWAIFETPWVAARLHYIAEPDIDRDMHDHPKHFLSIVLSGAYMEARPRYIDPRFELYGGEPQEPCDYAWRWPGSIAWRRATDRHRIVQVDPDTWTLFIFFGRKRHWWGYFTPAGKVFWKDYEAARPTIGAAAMPAVFRFNRRPR